MRKLAFIALLMGMLHPAVFAQTTVVKGTIKDPTGSPVPGASIQIKSTNKGTVSDADGAFSLAVAPGQTLVISSTGFIPVEVNASEDMSVTLELGSTDLSEVVVTAMGIQRQKKALGYAVQEVKGENLTVAKSVDVSSSLAGKVAGVQLVGSPSSTFDNASILIRGTGALGIANPIFVVDGTITDQSAVLMDNVESLSVLKGAAATALYGQRAASGVVVITTKKGSRRKSSNVEVNLGVTTERLSLMPPYQNQYAGGYSSSYTSINSLGAGKLDENGYYIFRYDPVKHPADWASFDGQKMLEYGADESWGPKIDGSLYRPYYSWYPGAEFGQLVPMVAQPDNVKDFFQTGVNVNNSVSFTTGAENYNFRLIYGNQNRTLVIPGANRNQNQIGINGSYDISKFITISTDAAYTSSYTKGKPREGYRLDGLNVMQNFNQWFQRQLDIQKMKNYRQPDGSLNSWNIGDPNSTGDFSAYSVPQYWDNPYFVIKENFGTERYTRLVGNLGLDLKFTRHLHLQSFARINQYSNENDFRVASGGLNQDSYSIYQDQSTEMNYETNLYYQNKFGNFSVDAIVGGNIRKNLFTSLDMSTAGGLSSPNYFSISASIARPNITPGYAKKKVNSVYGRTSFGYKDLIYVEGTLRNDWSSALPADANSYLYPSVSTSFIFTELLKGGVSNVLTFGKLRGSYASVGSDLSAHQLNIAIDNGSFYGTDPSVAIGNQFRGAGIRPSLTNSWEVGAELRFFNRVGLDVTIYKNNNIDQIIPIAVSGTSGFSTALVNAGNIQNKGIEVSINATVIRKGKFNWEIMLNGAKNSNFVQKLVPGVAETYLYATNRYDTRLEHRVGEEWGTYYGRKWRTDDKGNVIINASGLPEYDINQKIGHVLPDFTGGIFNAVQFGDFDLTFSIDFQKGGLFYSETRNFNTGTGLSKETVGVNDKGFDWRDYPGSYTLAGGNTGNGGIRIPGVFADGTENNRYISARSYWYTARQRDASNVLLDASYIKLREIRFGYSLPQTLISKLKVAKSANVGIIVQNAWLIWANTKQYGVDPSELEVFYREGGQLSSTRQIGLNLRVSF